MRYFLKLCTPSLTHDYSVISHRVKKHINIFKLICVMRMRPVVIIYYNPLIPEIRRMTNYE